MITNFERETHELNGYEINKLLPIIVQGLSTKIGKEKAITNKAICKALKEQGYKISDTRLRKVVHYIRIKNFVPLLIATSKGYYVATEKQEVESYIKSLSERINSINEVRNSLINQLTYA
jgi:predicted GTPase